MDHPQVMRGVFSRGMQVIPLRHGGEVGFDLVGRDIRAKDIGRSGTQGGHDGAMVMIRLAGQLGEGPAVDRPMLAVLEFGPKIRGSGPGVTTRMHEQTPQDLLVAHQAGEAVDISRVVDIVPLPIKTHDEVMADDAGSDLPLPRIEAKTFQHLVGDGHTAFRMAFDAAGLGDVMHEQDGVEQRRSFGTEDDRAVALIDVRLAGVNRIQFHQAAERMHVGRPTVVEFELHEAVQPGELRHETIKQAVLAQGIERAVDATALGEHRAEGAAGFLGRGKRRR